MKITLLLLLFNALCNNAFNIDDGCEVKEKWDIDYKWTEINIGAWIPHENVSELLSIDIVFRDHTYPSTYDNLDLCRNEIEFNRIREGKENKTKSPVPGLFPGDWSNFIFSIDANYGFMYLKTGNETLLSVKVDYVLDKLMIRGSNITVNCPSGIDKRVWKVSEQPVIIPLDSRSTYNISFFSTTNFTPEIELEKRKHEVGWDNGQLTMKPLRIKPLPPFKEHFLQLACLNSTQPTCDIKGGERYVTMEDNIQMVALPTSLSVRKTQGDFFYIILDTGSDSVSQSIEGHSGTAVFVLSGVLCLSLITISVLAVLVWKNRKVMNCKLSVNKGQEDVDLCKTSNNNNNNNALPETTLPAEGSALLQSSRSHLNT